MRNFRDGGVNTFQPLSPFKNHPQNNKEDQKKFFTFYFEIIIDSQELVHKGPLCPLPASTTRNHCHNYSTLSKLRN